MHDQVKKLSSFGFKATFGGPEPDFELTTERWRNTLESEIYQEILIGVAVDEVHCVAEWGS